MDDGYVLKFKRPYVDVRERVTRKYRLRPILFPFHGMADVLAGTNVIFTPP